MIRILELTLLISIICAESADTSADEVRKSLKINNCEPAKLSFDDKDSWSIGINRHCGIKAKVYEVIGAGSKVINGYYEPYGTRSDIWKYERQLRNGTFYRLQKVSPSKWTIERSDLKVMYRAMSTKNTPPKEGWKTVLGTSPPPKIILHKLSKLSPQIINLEMEDLQTNEEEDEEEEEEVDMYGDTITKTKKSNYQSPDAKLLSSMLHPAIGKELGRKLHSIYSSASPVPSIALDGVIKEKFLKKSLAYQDVPLSHWIGPETGLGCCARKYRLNFDAWRHTKYARALQSLINDEVFTSFLEELTGIHDLVPVKVDDDDFIQLGSSMIAVSEGGYLDVHNDFNSFNDYLHRRINVLFYLNEEWEEEWQGHLELWTANMTHCVQRITPTFNRMAIFTVTDDAFHGHPEPLTCPEDVMRYALQLVYYTSTPGPALSSSPGVKRIYNGTHSAVFQPYCAGDEDLKDFCNTCERDESYGDRRCCECNYDR